MSGSKLPIIKEEERIQVTGLILRSTMQLPTTAKEIQVIKLTTAHLQQDGSLVKKILYLLL
jgi:hypothetical protein